MRYKPLPMRSTSISLLSSPVRLALSLVALLVIMYIALIAIVMSYAAHRMQFSQSIHNDEATVATLEARYLAAVGEITSTDYRALGYAKPTVQQYVPAKRTTALR